MNAKIAAVAHILPESSIDSTAVESHIRSESPDVRVSEGIIESITGIRSRRFAETDEYNSTLAVRAAESLFDKTHVAREDIDLLIFAAAGQDLIEPATSHIVQDMLRTKAQVFDVKNACNSFINALEVASAFITSGIHRNVLVVTGETPSKVIKWKVNDRADLKASFAGYTLGDAGAAALVCASDDAGIIAYRGIAESSQWQAGTLPGGGSRNPRGDEHTYFRGDGAALKDAFEKIGPHFLHSFLRDNAVSMNDIQRIFMHQVSLPYMKSFADSFGIHTQKIEHTVVEHGNVAAATIPLGMSLCEERGDLKRGDLVLLLGLAGGISLDAMLVRW